MRRTSGEKRSGFIPQLPVEAFHWGQQKGWCRWQPAGDKGGGCSLSNPPTLSTSRWEERKLVEQAADTAVSGGLQTDGRGLASLKGPWCPRASRMPGTFMVLQRPLAKEWPSGVQVLPVLRWGQKRVRMGALARGGSREGTRVTPGTTRWPPHTPIKSCITEKLGSPSQPPVCSLAWPSRPPLSAPDPQEWAPKAIQKSHTSSNYSLLNICSMFIPQWGPPLGGPWGPQGAHTPALQFPPALRLQAEHHGLQSGDPFPPQTAGE